MIYRDIIESSGYEHASANASIMVRYGTYDINVMAIDTDDEEKYSCTCTAGIRYAGGALCASKV